MPRKQPAKRKPAKKTTARKRPAKKATPAKRPTSRVTRGELLHIPLDRIKPDPDNERKQLTGIDELAATMGDGVGIIESLTVGPEGADGKYPLVFGHRRLAAAKKAKLRTAPCIVRDLDEESRTETRLIENLHREDLTAREEADGYTKLVALGWSQRRIAERLGRSQSHVSKRLSLLALPEPALVALDSRRITIDDAEKLTKLKDHPDRVVEIVRSNPREIDWVVERQVRDLATEEATAELTEKLRTKGTVVITDDEVSKTGAKRVDSYGGVDVDKRKHAKEPCHAVVIRESYDSRNVEAAPYCTDPTRHSAKGDSDLKATQRGGASQKSKDEMRARREATKARHAFMHELLGRKPDRTKILELAARQYVLGTSWTERKAMGLLLGIEAPTQENGYGPNRKDWDGAITDYVNASGDNLLRACLAHALAQGEDGYRRRTVDHYRYLIEQGYEPNAVEKADVAQIEAEDAEDQAELEFTDEERSTETLADQRLANDLAAADALGLEPGDEFQDDGSILHEDGTVTPASEVGPKAPVWPPPNITEEEMQALDDGPPPVHPDQQTLDADEPSPNGADDDEFWDAQRAQLAGDDETETAEVAT